MIEPGIGFEARFGLFVGFEDIEVMVQETDTPFEGFHGMVSFEGVRLSLGFFDEFTVCHTGSGPVGGKMVGIELVKTVMFRATADNDVFAVMAAFFVGVHHTEIGIYAFHEGQIAHSTGSWSGIGRKNDIFRNNAIQTGNYLSFQMSCHSM